MARFVFVVQGEGRGHMTQAIALQDILLEAGHTLEAVLVGKSFHRQIPSFFFEKIKAPIHLFDSPNFVMDKQNRGIRIGATIAYNLWYGKKFFRSMRFLKKSYRQYQPDVIVNFYDLLAGLYHYFHPPIAPTVCVGHQFFLELPGFEFPKGHRLEKFLLRLNTRLTSKGAVKKLALAFQPYLSSYKDIIVVPPLLRKEVLSLVPEHNNFILAYVNNNGYGEEIERAHQQAPHLLVECFWDRKQDQPQEAVDQNLVFHKIDDQKFLEKMRTCQAFMTTAGFESVCEAMYLQKPVMMRPVDAQFEQACNALDAKRAGAGIITDKFDLLRLEAYLTQCPQPDDFMKEWVQSAPILFIRELEMVQKKMKILHV